MHFQKGITSPRYGGTHLSIISLISKKEKSYFEKNFEIVKFY